MSLENASDEALRDYLWRQGKLGYLLHEGQRELDALFEASPSKVYVVNCSRRWGKSYWLCVKALSYCLSRPKVKVRYAAPTAKMVRNIIEPHLKDLLEQCPPDLRPRYHRADGMYEFRNGSELHVAGCDNQGADRLRGVATDLGLVDEAGTVSELDYLVRAVLLPQTLTTGGRILMASTPPLSPSHPFRQYHLDALERGEGITRTIYDAPHIPAHIIEDYKREEGGEDSSNWRREYLAEFVVDDDLAVIPEWSKANIVTDEDIRFPVEFDAYVSADLGYNDLTVVLLAYYDFPSGVLYVIDEVVIQKGNSAIIDTQTEFMERKHFGRKEIRTRVADAPALVLSDLRNRAGRSWRAPRKDDADAALNNLRLKVQQGKVRVHERCTVTIAHMSGAIWNKGRTSYERSDKHGHFDGVDAMKYLVRHVNWNANPFKGREFDQITNYVPPTKREDESGLSKLIKRRGRNKWKMR